MEMGKTFWVKRSNNKPLGLVYRSEERQTKDTEFFHLSITKDMAEKGIPVEVPDVSFFHERTGSEKDLHEVPADKAKSLYDSYLSEKNAKTQKVEAAAKVEDAIVEEISETVRDVVKRGRKPKEA
jgi:hypothetical protein